MSTYTCPHCGQHDLSTQRRHNCPKLPSLSIPFGRRPLIVLDNGMRTFAMRDEHVQLAARRGDGGGE